MEQYMVRIEGMSCQGCVRNITGLLQALPGVEQVQVSLEEKRASLIYDPTLIGVAQFTAAIEEAGFEVL